MNWFNTILVLLTAFLAVFWEAAFGGIRHLTGVQLDLLPALMVYTSLSAGLITVSLLAFLGGLWVDSLSANPLGITVLPLFAVGVFIHWNRELILRRQTFAQSVIGAGATLAVAILTLLLLLSTGRTPLLGWGTLWQLVIMATGGGAVTPLFFLMFDWLKRMLTHGEAPQHSFRPDREIRRGRS